MYKNIISAMNDGRINFRHFKLTLNQKTTKILKSEDPNIKELVKIANLDPNNEFYLFKPITKYFPLINLQQNSLPILMDNEEANIIKTYPNSIEAHDLWIRVARENLALLDLNNKLADLDPDGKIAEATNLQLRKIHINIKGIIQDIKTSTAKGNLSPDETTRIKVLLHSIQKGELWGLNEANQILLKVGYRLIFNRGTVSLTNNLRQGKLVILSGPSATGKGENIKKLKYWGISLNQFHFFCTRDIRTEKNECQGNPYQFITAERHEIESMQYRSAEWESILIRALTVAKATDPNDVWYKAVLSKKMPNKTNPEPDKLAELVKAEKFAKKGEAGDFIATALVRTDFQGIPKDLFDEIHKGERLFIEVDTQLARQLVFDKNYEGLDAYAIMVLPPTAEELKSRMLNRNTEDIDKMNERLETAARELYVSKRDRIHDFYIDNDDLARSAREFGLTAGLMQRSSELWETYDGWRVSQAYLDIIKTSHRNKKIFHVYGDLKLSLNEEHLGSIGHEISNILTEKYGGTEGFADTTMILRAVENVTSKIPIEEKGNGEYALALMPGLNDPFNFGDVSMLLGAVIYKNLHGAIVLTDMPKVGDASTLSFHHRENITRLALEAYSPWLFQSTATKLVSNVLGHVRRDIGNGLSIPIIEENPVSMKMASEATALGWLKFMHPGTSWLYLTDSVSINNALDDPASENMIRNTYTILTQLDIPVLYFEKNNVPLKNANNMPEWAGKLVDEGFISECQLNSYDLTTTQKIREMLVSDDNNAVKFMSGMGRYYIKDLRLERVYSLHNSVEEGAINRDSNEYKEKVAQLKEEDLID